jgi:murein DD-endopeptidase MepM/ murein hydrolase activator NlpD
MQPFFNKRLKLSKQIILLTLMLMSFSMLVSACQLFTNKNVTSPLTTGSQKSYLFYELYDHSGSLCDIIVAANASDASKSVTLEKLLHSFSESSLPIVETSSKLNEDADVFSLQMNAFTNDTNYDTYRVDIDFSRELFQITEGESVLLYSTNSFNELFKSGLLEYFFPKNKLPDVQMTYNNKTLATQIKATWNHHIYKSYYATDVINNDFIATPDFNSHLIARDNTTINLALEYSNDIFSTPTASYLLYDASQNLIDENPITFDNQRATIPLPQTNGEYHLVINYDWSKIADHDYGSLTQTALLNVELPTSYELNNSEYEPGDLVVIKGHHINKDSVYTFETDIYHETLEWIHQDGGSYLFLPLMSRLSPSEYSFTIHEENNDGESVSTELLVAVIHKEFPTQHLKTSSSTASIRSNDNEIALVEAFNRGREISHNHPLWTGPFLQPVGGRISTEYGVIRYTNDSVESSRHNGIDFAIETGTPVVATETGYVRLSEHIAITGNTIFIDHGVGIFSQYYHLNSMDVEVGDFVEKGDIIGTVGSTGFSTGPHLHFSMYNNNIYVNPWKFFDAPPF